MAVNNQLVSVVGEEGIVHVLLVCALCCYINQQKSIAVHHNIEKICILEV